MSSIKKYLHKKNLQQPRNTSDNEDEIMSKIVEVQYYSGLCLGYLSMWRKLLFEHGLTVMRDAVMKAMRQCDPIGCQNRRKQRLLRRQYVNPGPNFCWNFDGYDKLKCYGFAIHGAICGFSRRILWLEVDVMNNDPKIIALYFLNSVKSVKFVLKLIGAYSGTENIFIEKTQKVQMALSSDRNLDGCFLYGKSTANQRIEVR